MSENTLEKITTYKAGQQEIKLSASMAKRFLVSGKNVTENEALMFVSLCKYNQLNPFVGDAYLIKYKDQAQMVVSKQAFMKRADRNPNYEGFEAGLIVQDEAGEIHDREGSFHLPGDKIVGGWCKVYRKGFRVPIVARVPLSEYGKDQSTWRTMQATMIRKVAVAHAHREAFPEEYSGLYVAEEFGRDDESLKRVEAELVQNKREKKTEVELPSGQIIKTAGIQSDALNVIQGFIDENEHAKKDYNYYLKTVGAEEMTALTEDEGEEIKQILMDRFADESINSELKMENKGELEKNSGDLFEEDK